MVSNNHGRQQKKGKFEKKDKAGRERNKKYMQQERLLRVRIKKINKRADRMKKKDGNRKIIKKK